jgi:hypothetical protein
MRSLFKAFQVPNQVADLGRMIYRGEDLQSGAVKPAEGFPIDAKIVGQICIIIG